MLYVLNGIFYLRETDMYSELAKAGISGSGLLKIRVNEETVVFKKYMKRPAERPHGADGR